MAVVATNNNKVVTEGKVKTPKLRYTLGDSELYFEPAQYLTAITELNSNKIKDLFSDIDMSLEETEGKSLKVMFKTPTEVKFCGFVTAGDASITLDASDIDRAMKSAQEGEIKKAISGKELVNLWGKNKR